MKRLLIPITCIIFLTISSMVFSQTTEKKNQYGQVVQTETGQKINLAEEELQKSESIAVSEKSQLKSAQTATATIEKTPIELQTENIFSIMGTCIGRNSMSSVDIDHDGMLELICSASAQTFGTGDYWYVMRYNPVDSAWYQVWTSAQYATAFRTLAVIDFNGDGNFKILLGFEDGTIDQYDAATKKLEKSVKTTNGPVNSIIYADADNDGQKEIVISGELATYLVNAETLKQKFKIDMGANYVRVGKLDNSGLNQIVLSSGFAYKVNHQANTDSTVISGSWNFNTSGDGYVELSDIDNDSKQEIIFAQAWQHIYVYDADTKTTKFGITTDLDINTLLLTDVNNDGVDDIIYGDGQWGAVHCYNAITQKQLWSVANPEHGVAAVNYADVNNDGKKELIWSAGWTSTGSDYLYVYDLNNKKLLWRSDDITGPFYATTSGDVDGDGKKEILTVSYKSESGYNGGILLVFDSETNRLKWKSSGEFNTSWGGLYSVVVNDIDGDGQNEIIIAAGQYYTGKIWIIDGKTHKEKSSYLYQNENINEFYSLAVDDIDHDGKKELVAASHYGIYVIDPTNFAVKWQITGSSSWETPIVKIADVDGDGNKEIIFCQNSTIQVINSIDHSFWTTDQNGYYNMDIGDYNNDGVQDIIASTTNGHIVVIDGNSRQIITDLNPEWIGIPSVRFFKANNSSFLVYACNGQINMYRGDNNCSVTQYLGTHAGEVEALQIFNPKTTSTDLIIGTSVSLLRTSWSVLSASPTELTVAAPENSTATFTVSSEKDWTASCNQDWLTLSTTSGSGIAKIKVTAKANTLVEKRIARVTISGSGSNSEIVNVTQAAAEPVLTVSTHTLTLGASAANSGSFDITSNLNWSVSAGKNWLHSNHPTGYGNLTVTVAADANLLIQERTDTLTISGTGVPPQKIVVTQEAGVPTLAVSANNIQLSASDGSHKALLITSNVSWKAVSSDSWLSLNVSDGSGDATLTLTASGNPSVEIRTATVTIFGPDVPTQTVTVTQDGQVPMLMVASNSISIGAAANSTKTITIASNVDWTVTCAQEWLTLSKTSGSKNGEITITAQTNANITSRTAIITISGTGVTPQIVNVVQDGGSPLLAVSANTLSISGAENQATFDIVSNTNWTLTCNQTWLSANVQSGSGNATITLTAEANQSSGIRVAAVVILAAGVIPQAISVMQGVTGTFRANEFTVALYPNPAGNELSVSGPENQAEISVYDLYGKLVLMQNAATMPAKININRLKSGIYTICVKTKNRSVNQKFVKK